MTTTPDPLYRFRNLSRLFTRELKRGECAVETLSGGDCPSCILRATEKTFRRLNRSLFLRLWKWTLVGAAGGFLAGIFFAYVIVPTGATYIYSSREGLLPPRYDMILRNRCPEEQAMRILEHEYSGRRKKDRWFGDKLLIFEAKIDDTTQIALTYTLSDKSLVQAIGLKKGADILENTLAAQVGKTGLDSLVRYLGTTGEVSTAIARGTARSAALKMEKTFRLFPRITVTRGGEGGTRRYINYLEHPGGKSNEFSPSDGGRKNIEGGDHVVDGRREREVTEEDRAFYRAQLARFLAGYFGSPGKK